MSKPAPRGRPGTRTDGAQGTGVSAPKSSEGSAPGRKDVRHDTVVTRAVRWSPVVLALVAAVGAAVWWGTRPGSEPEVAEPGPAAVRERSPLLFEWPAIPFADVTREAGIDFVHENGARGEKLLPETMGGGVAFLDWDADGDPDLLFTNGRPWPGDDPREGLPAFPGLVLYENDGTGRFTDITTAAGLDVDLYAMGVAAGDYDGDGRVDLYVTCLGENRLLRNTGERFEDVTERAGVAGGAGDWSTACGWFDYDRDGDLDLFVCNYLDWSIAQDVGQNFTLAGGKRAYGRPQSFGGTSPALYRNEGAGRFTEVSEASGIRLAGRDSGPDGGVPPAKSLGLTFADFDADGRLDVVVANDTVRNFLFTGRADGTFDERAILAGIAFDTTGRARAGMGIDVGDFRNDGTLGVAIGNYANEMTGLFVTREGTVQFDDEANSNGLGPATQLDLTFGTLFLDADNDGRLDLFAANGHLEEDIVLVQSEASYEQPPRLLWNAGRGRSLEFVPLPTSSVGAAFTRPIVGRGAAVADVDLDGDVDIVIAACGRAPRLLRNDQSLGHHWLRIVFYSPAPLVGTKVVATLPDGRTLRRDVMPYRGYLSQSEMPLTLGLGSSEHIDRLEVTWPDGRVERLEAVEVDRILKVVRSAE